MRWYLRLTVGGTDLIAVHILVVSAVAVFRLLNNLRQHQCLASLRLFTDLVTRSIHLQFQLTISNRDTGYTERNKCTMIISGFPAILVFRLFPIFFGRVLVFPKMSWVFLVFLCFYTANLAMNIKTAQISERREFKNVANLTTIFCTKLKMLQSLRMPQTSNPH